MSHLPEKKKPMPPWLMGLLIAAAIFAIGLLVFAALGFGDDPVIDPNASEALIRMFGS